MRDTWTSLSKRQRDTLVALVATSPASTKELVEKMDEWDGRKLTTIAATNHLKKLEGWELVETDRRGGENAYQVTEKGQDLVRTRFVEMADALGVTIHEPDLVADGGIPIDRLQAGDRIKYSIGDYVGVDEIEEITPEKTIYLLNTPREIFPDEVIEVIGETREIRYGDTLDDRADAEDHGDHPIDPRVSGGGLR